MLFPLWFQRSPSTSSPPRLHLVVGSQLNCQSRPDTNQRFVPADSKIISLAVHRQGYGIYLQSYGKWLGEPLTLSMCKFRSFPKNNPTYKTHMSKTTHLPKEKRSGYSSCDTAKSLGVAGNDATPKLSTCDFKVWQWEETIPLWDICYFWKRISMSCGTLWYSKSIFISRQFSHPFQQKSGPFSTSEPPKWPAIQVSMHQKSSSKKNPGEVTLRVDC